MVRAKLLHMRANYCCCCCCCCLLLSISSVWPKEGRRTSTLLLKLNPMPTPKKLPDRPRDQRRSSRWHRAIVIISVSSS
uniref:Putative secreted peptide n=1 Tax=Anopheles braziliensis TaxID=58242 RepID=A0A2M3ZN31_9DIPT